MAHESPTQPDSAEDVEAQRDPNSMITFVVGAVGIVLLIGTVIGTQALSYGVQEATTASSVYPKVELPDVLQAKQEWRDQLKNSHWVDRDKGVVSINIDAAKKMMLTELKTGAIAAPPIAPTPATAPAGGATPAK